MASAPFVTDLPVERPDHHGSHFDEPVVEPYLAKHSSWYRRHLASKELRKEPVTQAEAKQESQSRAEITSDANAPEATASEPQPGLKHAEHLPQEEQKRRRSSVMKGLRWAFWYNGNESGTRNFD